MAPTLRSAQVLKQNTEDKCLQGKEIAEYKQHQPLDIEERAAWRDAQKIQAEEIEGRRDQDGEDTSKAEEKNRADEIQIQVQIQMA